MAGEKFDQRMEAIVTELQQAQWSPAQSRVHQLNPTAAELERGAAILEERNQVKARMGEFPEIEIGL